MTSLSPIERTEIEANLFPGARAAIGDWDAYPWHRHHKKITTDHGRIGDTPWTRFNAGKADQIWYLTELARIFSERRAVGLLLDEFLIVVQELARRVRET